MEGNFFFFFLKAADHLWSCLFALKFRVILSLNVSMPLSCSLSKASVNRKILFMFKRWFIEGEVVKVPCSKADVFQTSAISLVEKRFLMKFLSVIQEPSLPLDWSDKSFADVLIENKMEGLLHAVVVRAICGVESADELSAVAGAELVKKYLASVGRFGPSPFLFPLYGGSEAAQAFCRLAAVHGGTYMLRKGVKEVLRREDGHVVVDSEDQEWQCKFVVMSPSSCGEVEARVGPIVYRACVAVKQDSMGVACSTHVVGEKTVFALHVDSSMKVAPEGVCLVYLWAKADVLAVVIDSFGPVEWQILWTTQNRQGRAPFDSTTVSHDPDQLELDFGSCIKEAQMLFAKIAPEGSKFF
jgi:RAB protein geranylgeranyltransferase component A